MSTTKKRRVIAVAGMAYSLSKNLPVRRLKPNPENYRISRSLKSLLGLVFNQTWRGKEIDLLGECGVTAFVTVQEELFNYKTPVRACALC